MAVVLRLVSLPRAGFVSEPRELTRPCPIMEIYTACRDQIFAGGRTRFPSSKTPPSDRVGLGFSDITGFFPIDIVCSARESAHTYRLFE